MIEGKIIKVAGPLVVADKMAGARMFDMVRVGEKALIGEIIELRGDRASIQVYEETAGIGIGERVISTGEPLSVELGPGLIERIYDGIQRPLEELSRKSGAFISRGLLIPGLNREKKWDFKPLKKIGEEVSEGDFLGEVQETTLINHKIMVPYGIKGTLTKINAGAFTVEETIAAVKTINGKEIPLTMIQKWPVRKGRPYHKKVLPKEPLFTGQRVIDALFPIVKGGTACIPGPFGSGKTVTQHQLAKWSDAQVVVYIGCGERGNEMTDVLKEFPELEDPKSGEPLMKRTILIANTSNMPVAAREASIYTGISLAEYFRDMGYDVALMADSTSRWAEAMREISGRLEEMPGEEGYPAYLGTKIAEFYERAGRVQALGQPQRIGSISAIGAVSPPGGDLSDPVVQATLRVVKVFWGLDASLAYKRHFPAINWLSSYSLYYENIDEFLKENVGEDWVKMRTDIISLLQKESELEEIVRLIGIDSLSPENRVIIETAKSVREDFLHQNSFHKIDSYCAPDKIYLMIDMILNFHREAENAAKAGVDIRKIIQLPVREDIARFKYMEQENIRMESQRIKDKIRENFAKI